MANEISVNLSQTISKTGESVSSNATYQANLAGPQFIGVELSVGTAAAAINIGGITPSVIFIKNLDTTNYVEIDSAIGISSFPQKLFPGQAILLLPETGTFYGRANTAPCQVWITAG